MKRRPSCPQPDKVSYPNERRARVGAGDLARARINRGEWFEPLYGYPCRAGHWHLTKDEQHRGVANVLMKRVPDELQVWARRDVASN